MVGLWIHSHERTRGRRRLGVAAAGQHDDADHEREQYDGSGQERDQSGARRALNGTKL
jgi:hypothetical protein